MISGDQIEHFLEESPHHESRLHGVFNKLTDIWQQQTTTAVTAPKTSTDVIESILPDKKNLPIAECGYREETEEESGASSALARRLEEELRAAKSAQLACGEVLLPANLLPRIARDVLRLAENEPCGLRGCSLFIQFENDQECRRIGAVKCDPNTVSTFEVYLTLKQDSSPWHSLLPQFIKNLTRGGTVVISQGYTLEKKKLYRSYSEQ